MCVCKRRFFVSFPGLFLKVPTGAVCVLCYWWAEWFAIPHVLSLTCRQHIERSVNKYIDAVLLFFFGIAMATLSLRLFSLEFQFVMRYTSICTLYGECQSGNVWRGGSPPTPLSSLQDRFLFAVPAAKLEDMRSNNFFFSFLAWCGGGGDDGNCACAWLFSFFRPDHLSIQCHSRIVCFESWTEEQVSFFFFFSNSTGSHVHTLYVLCSPFSLFCWFSSPRKIGKGELGKKEKEEEKITQEESADPEFSPSPPDSLSLYSYIYIYKYI